MASLKYSSYKYMYCVGNTNIYNKMWVTLVNPAKFHSYTFCRDRFCIKKSFFPRLKYLIAVM